MDAVSEFHFPYFGLTLTPSFLAVFTTIFCRYEKYSVSEPPEFIYSLCKRSEIIKVLKLVSKSEAARFAPTKAAGNLLSPPRLFIISERR